MGCVGSKAEAKIKEETKETKVQKQHITDRIIAKQDIILEIVIKETHIVSYQIPEKEKQIIKDQLTFQAQPFQKKEQQVLKDFQFLKFNKLYSKCLQNYEEHKIDKAGELCGQILSINLPQHQKQNLRKEYVNLYRIKREYQNMISINKQIYEERQWQEKSFKNGVRICTRRQDNVICVLIQSQIDIPFQVYLSIFTEIDLFETFMPFMVRSNTERIVARNRKIGFSASKFPFLDIRETFFQGIAYDRLQFNGSVFMYTTSIENNKALQQELNYIPQLNPQAVQLIYKYVALKYEPIQKNRGKVTLAINGDMKISLVPMFLMELLSVQFGNGLFEQVLKIGKKFQGSPWQEKVKENPHLFIFFKRILNSYLDKAKAIEKIN